VTNSSSFDWRRFDAYLFDIDGTLLNAQGGVHYNSFHTALREVYGCEGRIDEVPVHGNTDIGILRRSSIMGRLRTTLKRACRRLWN
jgi:hypothetical protein